MKIKPIEDHERLDIVADQLLVDQHQALAEQYALRQALAAKAHRQLTRLGREVRSWAAAGNSDATVGLGMANWLLTEGWTPPAPLEIEPEDDEDEDES